MEHEFIIKGSPGVREKLIGPTRHQLTMISLFVSRGVIAKIFRLLKLQRDLNVYKNKVPPKKG
jgi:hypothetical protein